MSNGHESPTGEDSSVRASAAQFDRLRQQHAPAIRRFLTSAGVGNDVDDCLQRVFIKLEQQVARHAINEAAVEGWLITVARNEARDRWRKRAVEQRYLAQLSVKSSTSAHQSAEAQLIRAERLKRLLGIVTADELGLIVLRFVDGLAVPDIASATGLPFATVKGRLDRAIAKMRRRAKEAEAS